jgi:hypothetical protein
MKTSYVFELYSEKTRHLARCCQEPDFLKFQESLSVPGIKLQTLLTVPEWHESLMTMILAPRFRSLKIS